jgi:hypothetical protein
VRELNAQGTTIAGIGTPFDQLFALEPIEQS